MTVDLRTAPILQVIAVSTLVIAFVVGFWWLIRNWERVWIASLSSRAHDRHFLRLQRRVFRGVYPLGHWNSPVRVATMKAAIVASRVLLIMISVAFLYALSRRWIK